MSIGSMLKSTVTWLWTGADGLRKVLHLLVLLFVFGIFFEVNADGFCVVEQALDLGDIVPFY